jgi:hypothetical protein
MSRPLAATNRPLFNYTGSRDLFRCPADRGLKIDAPSFGSAWPSWFEVLGSSYRYNLNPWVANTRATRADPVLGLAEKPESWITEPSRHVVMQDPPALPDTVDDPAPLIFFSHYSHGATAVTSLRKLRQRAIAPILFVDGHAIHRDFTRFMLADPFYPAEPRPEWVWYKPRQ